MREKQIVRRKLCIQLARSADRFVQPARQFFQHFQRQAFPRVAIRLRRELAATQMPDPGTGKIAVNDLSDEQADGCSRVQSALAEADA